MKENTISEVKELLSKGNLDGSELAVLRQDKRKGIKKMIEIYDKKQEQAQLLHKEYEEKRLFDNQYAQAEALLAGVDEVGRGPLAGPVIAAAVILPDDFKLLGLTDSKQLSGKKRKQFYQEITNNAICYHIAIIDSITIDRVNIYEATKLAMKEALMGLYPQPSIGLIDAVHLEGMPFIINAITKGDDKSLSIAAASVLAKVKRDELMEQLHDEYPMYHFSKNKGYGTKEHLQALQLHGPCRYHRRSFSPINTMTEHTRSI